MREYDLELCPWCGSEAMMSIGEAKMIGDDGEEVVSHIVRCSQCVFTAGIYYDNGKVAERIWNDFCHDVERGRKAWWAIHMADDFCALIRALLGIIPPRYQRKWPKIINRAKEFLLYEQHIGRPR